MCKKAVYTLVRYSEGLSRKVTRGDLCLHEDEDENKQGWQDAGGHHPHGELSV